MPIPYCLNIHPGESLADTCAAIERYALAVKARVSAHVPYPLGLRLAATAAEELADPAALESFRDLLARNGLFVTGINGFPYGTFHNTTVKTAVYQPDWSTPERLNYTGRLGSLLAAILPEGRIGNISTVPLGYKASRVPFQSFASSSEPSLHVRQIAVMAEFLYDLKQTTGREIVLALEPEPDCLLEDTADVIAWFEDELLVEGKRWLSSRGRRTPHEAEALLRTTIGLCLDTCHFAVEFEDPLTALARFESACIRVARIQLSAAIRTTITDESLTRLAAFIDPVYLHQTKIRLPRGRIVSFPDLTKEALESARQHAGCELRTHFHVPLFYTGDAVLGSTHIDLSPEFFAHVQAYGYPLEIETYTYNVLPTALRSADIVDSLVAEHEWVMSRLFRTG
ncbi:MAG: metabolite traffic protein EboE [bacterium]